MGIERRGQAPSWVETLVKAGVAAVPLVGGSLSTVVGDVAARRRDRVTDFGEAAVSAAGDPGRLVDRIRRDERVADLFLDGAVAASATSLRNKRLAMGRVVAHAVEDDADVDVLQLVMSALADLEAPHFAALAKLAQGGQDHVDWARHATEDLPLPVVAALIRHGTVTTVGTMDGAQVVSGISPFGESLLEYVAPSEPPSG